MRRPVVAMVLTPLVLSLGLAACSDDEGSGDAADAAAGATTSSTVASGDDLAGCESDAVVEPGTERISLSSGGVDREVERVVPPGYDGSTPHPLVVSLHGFTSTIEQQNLFSGLPEEAAARGYVLLTPQAEPATLPIGGEELRAPFWNLETAESSAIPDAQDDVTFLTELLDATASELCIDPDRIYVTGNSNGAGMSVQLACALPGRLAAIAPVSGVNLTAPCDEPEPVSVVAFHGDADPLVPYEGETAAGVEVGNPPVEDRVAELAEVAGCAPEPELTSPFPDIALRQWTGCVPGVAVELYTVLGGGHTWPGMLNYVDTQKLVELSNDQALTDLADVDVAAVAGHMTLNVEATTTMLDFFDAHPRPG
jgi:polyhydroxybutyrate depolymerase